MSYDRIREVMQEEGLTFRELDRILVHEDTMAELRERVSDSTKTSDYATDYGPAIRTTNGAEKLVWVDKSGYMQEVEL